MPELREEIVNACIEKRKQGMDLSHIRKELKQANIDEDEIKVIMGLVDNYDRRTALKKAESAKKKEFFFAGLVLFIAGIALSFGFTDSNVIVLFYGAILSSLPMMGYGYSGLLKK